MKTEFKSMLLLFLKYEHPMRRHRKLREINFFESQGTNRITKNNSRSTTKSISVTWTCSFILLFGSLQRICKMFLPLVYSVKHSCSCSMIGFLLLFLPGILSGILIIKHAKFTEGKRQARIPENPMVFFSLLEFRFRNASRSTWGVWEYSSVFFPHVNKHHLFILFCCCCFGIHGPKNSRVLAGVCS